MPGKPDPLQILPFASAGAWEQWLEEHHDSSNGLLLKLAKKVDDSYYLQRFTPRKPKSKWSQVNLNKVAMLVEAGRMRPAGMRQVELAQTDGRWDAAYEPPSKATVPDDLRRELDKNSEASRFFATLDGRNRYAILYQIGDAKKPETRARRIEKFVAMLAERKKPYP